MKQSILGFLCLILVLSCDVLEIPQSITIKGKPGLYLPLGSPFSNLDDDKKLEYYINSGKIMEMMGQQDGIIKIYDFLPPNAEPDDPQTYIVHYPIAEMKYDLTEYVGDVLSNIDFVQPYTIPDDIANFPYPIDTELYLTREGIQANPGTPLFTVPLADMSKLVIEVNDGPFGLELDYREAFEDNLQLRIPAFGIDTYQKGIKVEEKLRFVNPGKTQFKPGDDLSEQGELEVYVKVLGACSGTILPLPVFEWESAIIDISGQSDKLAGSYTIQNFLGNFLGEGIAFDDGIKAYIYVNGIGGNDAKLVLKAGGNDLVPEGTPLLDKPRPSFTNPFNEPLPEHSLDTEAFVNLTWLLNNPDPSTLEYRINADQMTVYNEQDEIAGKTITADLVVLLPLQFIVTTPSSEPGYVKLDLNGIFPDSFGEGDLFQRKGKDDDLFSNIESVTVFVKNPLNTIIGNPISILLESPREGEDPYRKRIDLDFDKKENPLTIRYDELPNPFIPRFEILLKKDDGEEYSTFTIKRQDPNNPPKFDFFLTVEAKTDLNIKL